MKLDEIALAIRTDKSSRYHNYTPTYEFYLERLREEPITLLELGIGDIYSLNREGESWKMWTQYFKNGTCYFVDNDIEKVDRVPNGIHADQTNENKLESLISRIGNPDIIIDDASHIQNNTIKSFEILFPLLKSGGYYFIEDTVTSYWPDWGGSVIISHLYETHPTIVSYMMELCHYINLKRQETFNPPRNVFIPEWIKEIDFISFHHSLIVIKKK